MTKPYKSQTEQLNQNKRLIQRLNAIARALENKTITLQALSDIASAHVSSKDTLKKLKKILSDEQTSQIPIADDALILSQLNEFDEIQGNYLDLNTLATSDHALLEKNLSDLATLYLVFGQHLPTPSENDFNHEAAFLSIHAWIKQRPLRLVSPTKPSSYQQTGLLEKFLTGTLGPHEWLSARDMERALKIFGLEQQVNIVRLDPNDIALSLHHARENHLNAKTPYQIPFLINLGEDQLGRINDHGVHWANMRVTVDPNSQPLEIKITYTDALKINPAKKTKIEKCLKQAFNTTIRHGDYSTTHHQTYAAFPGAQLNFHFEDSLVTAKTLYFNGYVALVNLIEGLKERPTQSKILGPHGGYEEYLEPICEALISEQTFTESQYEALKQNPLFKPTLSCFKQENASTTKTSSDRSIDKKWVKALNFSFQLPDTQKQINRNKQKLLKSKQSAFNFKALEALNTQRLEYETLQSKEAIQDIASEYGELSLDINQLLESLQGSSNEAKIHVLFEAISFNKNISHLKLQGIPKDKRTRNLLKTHLDTITSRQLSSQDKEFQPYIRALNQRNEMLQERHLAPADYKNIPLQFYNLLMRSSDRSLRSFLGPDQPWQLLFQTLLFELPTAKTTDFIIPRELGLTGLMKCFEFLKDHEEQLSKHCPFKRLIFPAFKGNPLKTLAKQLESAALPFEAYQMTVRSEDLDPALLETLDKNPEITELTLILTDDLNTSSLETLIQLVDQNPNFKTRLILKPPQPLLESITAQLKTLENAIEKNRRRTEEPLQQDFEDEHTQIPGNIAKTLFGELGQLDTDIQIEAQVQQQVQQQIQTSLDDSEEPDEREAREETFDLFETNEPLIYRFNIKEELGDFIQQRTSLKPEQCWDLITGENANHFRYGIQAMTKAALKQLIDHLDDCRYGLHPDNLPEGFSLAQKADNLTLTYEPLNPKLNPNQSPLTPGFEQALAKAEWHGDILQFLTEDEAKTLHADLYGKPGLFKDKRPNLQTCIHQFFFLNTTASKSERLLIIQAFLKKEPQLYDEILSTFGDDLGEQNLSGLAELIYSGQTAELKDWLEALNQLKQSNPDAFQHFKTYFIDPSENWTEFMTEDAIQTIKTITFFSPEQLVWWEALTEQHTSNQLGDFEMIPPPERRRSNPTHCMASFQYFLEQLDELHPGLKLTQYCPLEQVDDMHVGLDRLLTILRNAHDIEEQFYLLDGLTLDPLGPFYASRYEGFTVVTKDMDLQPKSIRPNFSRKKAENQYAYRSSKERIESEFHLAENDEFKYFMRYIAGFNQRAAYASYEEGYNKIIENQVIKEDEGTILINLLTIVAIFGTGRYGKQFNSDQINALLKQMVELEKHGLSNDIFQAWKYIRQFSIKLSIEKITEINAGFFPKNATEQTLQINKLNFAVLKKPEDLFKFFPDQGDLILEGMEKAAKNKTGYSVANLTDSFHQHTHPKPLPTRPGAKSSPSSAIALGQNRLIMAELFKIFACLKPTDDQKDLNQTIKKQCKQLEQLIQNNPALKRALHQAFKEIGRIDVIRSTDLPSLKVINAIISDLQSHPETLDNQQIWDIVSGHLPEGVNFEPTTSEAQVTETASSQQAAISKHMAEIIRALEKSSIPKQMLEQQFGEDFKRLKSAEGPRFLIQVLNEVKGQSGFLAGIVQNNIKSTLVSIYDGVIITALSNFKASSRDAIKTLFAARLPHPIKSKDFGSFCEAFATELKVLEDTLSHLTRIQRQWPDQFLKIATILKDHPQTTQMNMTQLSMLLTCFSKAIDKQSPFPVKAFKEALTQNNVENTLYLILPEQSNTYGLNDEDLSILIKITPKIEESLLSPLLSSKTERPYFSLLLTFLDENTDQANLILNKLTQLEDQLEDKALVQKLLQTFKQFEDFNTIIDSLLKTNKTTSKILCSLIFKLDTSKVENLSELMTALAALEPNYFQRIQALYATEPYPDSEVLSSLLQADTVESELEKIERQYDRDPYGHREATELLNQQFDNATFKPLIEALQDFNYERPLLLTQRQELYDWLTYINAIGQDKPISISPWDDEKKTKPVKDLSQSEIAELSKYYKTQLKDNQLPNHAKIRIKLEFIALMREVMYRSTTTKDTPGHFPYPTQLLYVLASLQQGDHFIGKIQTGQGKSLTAALSAGLNWLEGKTVDICTSNLFLAQEGLDENQAFFNALNIPTHFIHEGSSTQDHQEGAVHYSSLSDLALYRSRMELKGHEFPQNEILIADEVDFSSLDDDTRYRFAVSLEQESGSQEDSPYLWIYEALNDFVDVQTKQPPLSDEAYLESAKAMLAKRAQGRQQKLSLSKLDQKQLKIWLMASAKTHTLIEQEEIKFRILSLEKQDQVKTKLVSKACILVNGRPNLKAQYSDAVQQCLHVRLRQKYKHEIDSGKRPDFLVEPEKTYITSLNANLMLKTYQKVLGMSGTVGSAAEIKEQHDKYGFRFIDIPPYQTSQREDLKARLTHKSTLQNSEEEEKNHNKLIVDELIWHLKSEPGSCSPVLILCENEIKGAAIAKALEVRLEKNPALKPNIQQFYSSEKATPKARNEEEKAAKEAAGKNNQITISSVFGRGTDIKPTHKDGLYVIQTFVDTKPYSAEDLERARRQKTGRAGRQGQKGQSRLILKRSQFQDIASQKELKRLQPDAVDKAIAKLNVLRNAERTPARQVRETFDAMKHELYQQFLMIHQNAQPNEKTELIKSWNQLLQDIDEQWHLLNQDETGIQPIIQNLWSNFISDLKSQSMTIPSKAESLQVETIYHQVTALKPAVKQHYIRTKARLPLEEKSVDLVYSLLNPMGDKTEAVKKELEKIYQQLQSPAHVYQLKRHFPDAFQETFNFDRPEVQTQSIVEALLYLRYQAWQKGNPVAYAKLNKQIKTVIELTRGLPQLNNAVSLAHQTHCSRLVDHQGKQESSKQSYLSHLMTQLNRLMPTKTANWKKINKDLFWFGSNNKTGLRSRITQSLTTYQNHWWFWGYVSPDRKKIANEVISSLQGIDPFKTELALQVIHTAKSTILADDKKNYRSVQSGLEGRLYKLLDQAEKQIIQLSAADQLDDCIHFQFRDIATTLRTIKDRFPETSSLDFKTTINILNADDKTPAEKYQHWVQFCTEISMKMPYSKKHNNAVQGVLYRYTQQKSTDLIEYFKACDKHYTCKDSDPILLYQATSKATIDMLMDMKTRIKVKPSSSMNSSGLSYRNYKIQFEDRTDQNINTTPFYKAITHPNSLRVLLEKMETRLVELSHNSSLVIHFESINIFNEGSDSFSIKLKTSINGEEQLIQINIDPHKKTVLVDSKLLESKLSLTPKGETQQGRGQRFFDQSQSLSAQTQKAIEDSRFILNEISDVLFEEVKSAIKDYTLTSKEPDLEKAMFPYLKIDGASNNEKDEFAQLDEIMDKAPQNIKQRENFKHIIAQLAITALMKESEQPKP